MEFFTLAFFIFMAIVIAGCIVGMVAWIVKDMISEKRYWDALATVVFIVLFIGYFSYLFL